MNPVHHTFPLCFFKIHVVVLPPVSARWAFTCRFYDQNFDVSYSTHACYVSCPSQPWFDHIWWSRQVVIIYKCTVRFSASFVHFGSKMLSSVQFMPDKTILFLGLWVPMVNPHYSPYITTAAESCILQQSHTFHSDINCVTHSAVYIVSRFLSAKPMKYNDCLSAFFLFHISQHIWITHLPIIWIWWLYFHILFIHKKKSPQCLHQIFCYMCWCSGLLKISITCCLEGPQFCSHTVLSRRFH